TCSYWQNFGSYGAGHFYTFPGGSTIRTDFCTDGLVAPCWEATSQWMWWTDSLCYLTAVRGLDQYGAAVVKEPDGYSVTGKAWDLGVGVLTGGWQSLASSMCIYPGHPVAYVSGDEGFFQYTTPQGYRTRMTGAGTICALTWVAGVMTSTES